VIFHVPEPKNLIAAGAEHEPSGRLIGRLDLVEPVGAARRGFGWRRQTGFDAAGGPKTRPATLILTPRAFEFFALLRFQNRAGGPTRALASTFSTPAHTPASGYRYWL
jgi:hypothetical protein